MFNHLPSVLLIDIFKKKHKVYWSDETIAFNGITFMILNQKAFDCQHGKDRNINKKNKSAESNKSIKKLRYSKIDQECLVQKIIDSKKEQPFDNLFFRPKGENICGNSNKAMLGM